MTLRNTEGKDEEDRDLVSSLKQGDPEPFRRIVEKYQKRIYNFGLKICPSAQDAEDMVQDSFINAFRAMKDFRGETSLKNWLYLIASSVCRKMKRKKGAVSDRELSLEEFMPGDPGDGVRELPGWVEEPVEKLLNRELNRQLHEAISKLPADYRLVLVLRDMEGFPTDETAKILGITPANVKVRLHRARLFLRDGLKEYYERQSR
jgi:RNA polymerase sigma-70 factor (ECF subfamily)